MGRPEAFLLDVYETVLTCDFNSSVRELAAIAGLPAAVWNDALARYGPSLMEGRLTVAQAMQLALQACGAPAHQALVDELVRKDQEVILASARLHDDVVPFLEKVRPLGIKVALVSNCADDTRPLLTSLGTAALADAVVLSCEIGYAKPSPEIYRRALGQLGTGASRAVFVDDQERYCAGARAVGMSAVQIIRGDGTRPEPERAGVVRSLRDLEALL